MPRRTRSFSLANGHVDTIQTVAADAPDIGLAGYRKWGYLTGYEADYKLAGTGLVDTLTGPVEIESTVSVYRDVTGAKSSFAKTASNCSRPPLSQLAVGAKIGDDARLCTLTKTDGNLTVRAYVVTWRRGDLKAAVFVAATEAGASPTLAVRLAKVQDARMH